MEPMTYRKEIDLSAPLERVWSFIGTGEGLSRWFNAQVTLETRLGGRYEERKSFGNPPHVIGGHVIDYEPPRRLVISCRVETTPEATWPVYTTIRFLLLPTDNGTHLDIEHSGFENLPEAYRDRLFAGFTQGWNHEIETLIQALQVEPIAN